MLLRCGRGAGSERALRNESARLCTAQRRSRSCLRQAVTTARVCLHDVSFTPPGSATAVLAGATLSLPATGLVLLVGASGSGKTTLLSLVAGLCEPTSGRVCVGEAAGFAGHTPASQRSQRVGFVFQFPERHFLGATLSGELTFGWPRGDAEGNLVRTRRVLATLSACGLAGLPLSVPLASLSGGMQRRVALAVQLLRGPEVLLLDEPLAGVDWEARAELLPLLSLAAQRSCVLVVTHDTKQLLPLADSVWRLEGGQLTPESKLTAAAR